MYRLGVFYYWKYRKAYIFTIRTIAVQNVHPKYICHWHPAFANITRRTNSHRWEFWGRKQLNWHRQICPNWSKSWHCWFIFRAINCISFQDKWVKRVNSKQLRQSRISEKMSVNVFYSPNICGINTKCSIHLQTFSIKWLNFRQR